MSWVYLHLSQKSIWKKFPNIWYFFSFTILRKWVEIEIDPMRKIKISKTTLNNEINKLFISEILLNDHIGNHLWNEVLEIITLISSMNHWIDSFGWEQGIYLWRWNMILVKIIQDFIDWLLVVVLNVLEFLYEGRSTMFDDFSLLSIGIFSKTCSFLSA